MMTTLLLTTLDCCRACPGRRFMEEPGLPLMCAAITTYCCGEHRPDPHAFALALASGDAARCPEGHWPEGVEAAMDAFTTVDAAMARRHADAASASTATIGASGTHPTELERLVRQCVGHGAAIAPCVHARKGWGCAAHGVKNIRALLRVGGACETGQCGKYEARGN